MDELKEELKSVNWEKVKLVAGGAIAGAFVLTAIGFGWAGWMFESKAEEMAEAAVIERLVPICVAQFKADPQRKQKLERLKDTSYLKQIAYIEQQGWATMPGAEKPNTEVASRCIREIRFTTL